MAETGVWAPCESPAHAASMAASTSDADLMVTVGDRVVVDGKQKTFTIRPQATGCGSGCLLKSAHSRACTECTFQPAASAHDLYANAEGLLLAARTPSMTPAPRGVAAEPERRAAARARLSGGLGHRLRPSPDLDWPGGRSRRPCRARGDRTGVFNVCVPYTRRTSPLVSGGARPVMFNSSEAG